MSKPRDRIVGPLKDKLPDADSSTDLDDQLWSTSEVRSDEEFKIQIQINNEDKRENVVAEIKQLGITVGTDHGRVIRTRATAEEIFNIAEIADVKKVFEDIPDQPHVTSEGVGVSNADTVQSRGLTGNGVKVAIIDLYGEDSQGNVTQGFYDETHKEYGSNVVDTIQSGDPNTKSYFVQKSELHGTGCTEIIHDIVPDADLVLCAYDNNDSDGDIVSMLKKIEKQQPDTAVVSISLGGPPTDRLDGLDSTSKEMEKFTTEGETVAPSDEVGPEADRGRVIAISAGNFADGYTWHGQYTAAADGTLEFHSNEDYLELQNAEPGGFVFANWDSWDESSQEYSIALYEDADKTALINSTSPQDNWAYLQVPTGYSGDTIYFEVTKESADRNHEFDICLFDVVNMQITKHTTARSLAIPATARDTSTLTTGALQATDFGIEPNAGDVKSYSSRGPTRDGRDGIDITGPARVSQTDQGYGTATFTQDPGQGFNGTSAAAPHIAGAAAQLLELDRVDNVDATELLTNNAAGIPDSNFTKSDNTVVGNGYLDVKAAYDEMVLEEPLSQQDSSNQLGGDPQFTTPAVGGEGVYVGGLQKTFYALALDDLSTQEWGVDRGTKAGLSDSSAHLTGDKLAFGSGQGKLYVVDATDGTKPASWDPPKDLGSAICSTPTTYNGTIFVGTNDGTVYAFDVSTGNQQWSSSVSGPVYSDLLAHNGELFVTTQSGTLAVLNTADGTKKWTASHTEFGTSSPAVGDGNVYVAADEVYAYKAGSSSANQQWKSSTFGGTAGSNPLYHDSSVYVGSANGNLHSYSAVDGSENWSASADGTIAASPAINDYGNRIAVISMKGTLYLYDTGGEQKASVSISNAEGTQSTPAIDDGELFLPTAEGTVVKFT